MEKTNNKNGKLMFGFIVFAILLIVAVGIAYAFFNYTRTGTANTIKTGRIAFNSVQGESINLTNMFPIDVTNGIPDDNTKVGTVTINVTGDTTYAEGVEYLVSAVNVTNSVGTKSLPISIDVSVSSNTNNDPATTLGTVDSDYFTNRGGNTSIYKVLANDTISTDDKLVVGYIAPGATGVDGNILVRAYLDKAKIAIVDTYNGEETDNMGTPTSWVDDRVVLTTVEWNSLQQDGVSFKVKVESNEGIWVEEPSIVIYPVGKTKETVDVGDTVIIGTEEFNVVKHDGSDLVLLSHYNLNVGNNSYGTATGIQDSNCLGSKMDYNTYGTVSFANTNYWKNNAGFCGDRNSLENCVYVYNDNSSISEYVGDYKEILENFNIQVKDARLLSIEEAYLLLNSGNSSILYNTSFWLGTAYNDNNILSIQSTFNFMGTIYQGAINGIDFPCTGYYVEGAYGVRPVIVI